MKHILIVIAFAVSILGAFQIAELYNSPAWRGEREIKHRALYPDSIVITDSTFYKSTGATCFVFKSKNGFGMTVGSMAILPGYGSIILPTSNTQNLLNHTDTFQVSWKFHCTDEAREPIDNEKNKGGKS